MEQAKHQLIVVGAGPGDPDLITLKAVKALKNAAVILYDALANEALLDHAPDALKIYVGKRAGLHHKQQNAINRMIVAYITLGNVVRLKGGDPFIFGRGHEEMAYAQKNGISSSYIPGISSSTAVPGLVGIPLTKRGVNESFWVVTGTLKDGSLSKDVRSAASSSATVVILMGVKKLHEIVTLFTAIRGKDEPIALIENGSLPQERQLISRLGEVLEIQNKIQINAPAIILIGNVINEKIDIGWVKEEANYQYQTH